MKKHFFRLVAGNKSFYLTFKCENCETTQVVSRYAWYNSTVERGHIFNKIKPKDPCSS